MIGRALARLAPALGLVAIAWGAFAAIRMAWLCDDAFISFRYAENLTRGLGLVYNAGERVEGYSNFLWTLGIALGMRLGIAPETWSIAWGVAFYVATLALLLAHSLGARDAAPEGAGSVRRAASAWPPIACLLAAVHPDWQAFATSGLETSLFTFLLTAGYVLAVEARWGRRGLAASGLALALAALTRPDGLMFAPIVVLYALWARRPRLAGAAAFGGAFLAVWLPYAIWKIAYYGDFLPNTYYAKSASLAWYDQGWCYVSLYFRRYWVLALASPVAAVALAARARGRSRTTAEREPAQTPGAPIAPLILALALGLAYTFCVMRVGGDFMYARFLIPATPFYAIALARGIELLPAARPAYRWATAAALAAGVALTPSLLAQGERVRGITDERLHYRPERVAHARRDGLVLRRYFQGLPVRIAFGGAQAALAYYARPPVAIEGATGLTDRWIARQPLAARGRIGHEKVAPVSYLLQRSVHFSLYWTEAVDDRLPMATIAFDSVDARMIHWDPALLAELGRRGARFTDVPAEMDREIAGLDHASDERARDLYRRFEAFYFDFVSDPARQRMFRERLAPIAQAAR